MLYPYQKPKEPEESRVQDLLSRMTLEEKFSQLRMNDGINRFLSDRTVTPENFETRFAEVFDPARTSCCYANSDCSPVLVNLVQRYSIEHSRLGIPLFVMGEAVHGSMTNGSTVFPQAIGLGSTFDPDLLGEIAAVCGKDSHAGGSGSVRRTTLCPHGGSTALQCRSSGLVSRRAGRLFHCGPFAWQGEFLRKAAHFFPQKRGASPLLL